MQGVIKTCCRHRPRHMYCKRSCQPPKQPPPASANNAAPKKSQASTASRHCKQASPAKNTSYNLTSHPQWELNGLQQHNCTLSGVKGHHMTRFFFLHNRQQAVLPPKVMLRHRNQRQAGRGQCSAAPNLHSLTSHHPPCEGIYRIAKTTLPVRLVFDQA